ncbi:hypothetical protein K438DRAFT_1983928 [Mycena galopus ATCC 62051]|nr:hypothetical protein K438DRAFT_1983928 [Mycena galopus ATCC 62051]
MQNLARDWWSADAHSAAVTLLALFVTVTFFEGAGCTGSVILTSSGSTARERIFLSGSPH